MADLVLEASIKSLMIFALAMGGFAYATWIERKFIARLQMRYGPNRAGKFGLLHGVRIDAALTLLMDSIASEARGKSDRQGARSLPWELFVELPWRTDGGLWLDWIGAAIQGPGRQEPSAGPGPESTTEGRGGG